MEMMTKGKVKLYSEYCKEKNIEIEKDDEYGNLVASLDSLVSQAIELAKSENKNLEDFRIKIFEILFFRKNVRKSLKAVCAKDEKLKEKFEELEIGELKN